MVKKENPVLICKCKKIDVKSDKGGVFDNCVCGKPNAKDWKYKKVIIQEE